MNRNEKALIYKDIKEITSSKKVFMPMAMVPLILIILVPIGFLIAANYVGTDSSMYTKIVPLIEKFSSEYGSYNPSQVLIKVAIDLLFPTYFLIIPVLCSGVIGASSFVGEKEHKTMESLLYTPISMEQLLKAKVLGVLIPSFLITFASFIIFAIIMNIGGFIYFSGLIFPNVKWLIIILWISPAINLLSLIITVMVSAKSETFQEAQQVSGVIIIPLALLLVAQMSGVILISNLAMIIGGAVIFLADYILIKRIPSKFITEKLI